MISYLFNTILNISVVACYVILVVLVIRFFLLKWERRIAYFLWAVVFINLCFPIKITGPASLIPERIVNAGIFLPESLGRINEKRDVPEENIAVTADGEPEHTVRKGQDFKWENIQRVESINFLEVAAFGWIFGIIVIVVFSGIKLIRLKVLIGKSGDDISDERIKYVDGISTPFLWGLHNAKIYLPSDTEAGEMTYIIAHENFHRKRKDPLFKAAAFVIVSVHWFNPLAWLAYALFVQDMEMSCDEAILRNADVDTRKQYAESLLKYAAKQNGYILTPVTFGEPALKSRIKNVLKYKKKNVAVTCALAVGILGIMILLVVRPREVENQKLSEAGTAEQEGAVEDERLQSAMDDLAEKKDELKSKEDLLEQEQEAISEQGKQLDIIYMHVDEWAGENLANYENEDGTGSFAASYRILDMSEESANIIYYSCFDYDTCPRVVVTGEFVRYELVNGRLENIERIERQYDYIAWGMEYMEAYPYGINDTPMDYNTSGVGVKLNELATKHPDEFPYVQLFEPETAALYQLNLLNNENKVKVRVNPSPDSSAVHLQIDFYEDGKTVYVRAIKPYGGDGIWIIQDEDPEYVLSYM